MNDTAPYAALTPDVVLDALDSAGFTGDGRLLALNSYENRVYRAHLADGAVVVAKFYRPGRWSDPAILEEHAFAAELASAEVPLVAPLVLQSDHLVGPTLAFHEGFRFSVCPSRPGRSPELEHDDTLRWIGRFIGRMHAIGARTPFEHREALDVRSFGEEPRAYVLASGLLPPDLEVPYRAAADMAIERVRACFGAVGGVRALRLHGDAMPATFSGTRLDPALQRPGRISSTSTTRAWGPRSRISGCCCRASVPR